MQWATLVHRRDVRVMLSFRFTFALFEGKKLYIVAAKKLILAKQHADTVKTQPPGKTRISVDLFASAMK